MEDLIKLQQEKQVIHNEISSYGIKLDEIKILADKEELNLIAKKKEGADLDAEILKKKNIIEELNPIVLELEEKKTKLDSDISSMEKSLEKKDEIEQSVKEGSENLQIIGNETIKANNQKDIAENTLKMIENKIESKTIDLSNLESDYILKEEQLKLNYQNQKKELNDELGPLSLTNETLKKENETLGISGEAIKATILPLAQKADMYTEMIAGLEEEYNSKKNQKEKELLEMSKEQDARQLDQDKREGDISLENKWLDEKKDNLKFIKVQLEKKIGRPINLEI